MLNRMSLRWKFQIQRIPLTPSVADATSAMSSRNTDLNLSISIA